MRPAGRREVGREAEAARVAEQIRAERAGLPLAGQLGHERIRHRVERVVVVRVHALHRHADEVAAALPAEHAEGSVQLARISLQRLLAADRQREVAADHERVEVGVEAGLLVAEVEPRQVGVLAVGRALLPERGGLFEVFEVESDAEALSRRDLLEDGW